jgi:hypothetical protein
VKGLYLVRFKIGSAAPTVVGIVRPKARRVKPGGPIRTWVESQPENGDFPTPQQAIREVVRRLWKKYEEMSQDQTLSTAERENWKPERRLGAGEENITLRLIRELRKASKGQK